MVALLSKFTVLCLSSYFVVYLLKLKLILFYNRVVYHYTRIFLIFLLHPVYIKHLVKIMEFAHFEDVHLDLKKNIQGI